MVKVFCIRYNIVHALFLSFFLPHFRLLSRFRTEYKHKFHPIFLRFQNFNLYDCLFSCLFIFLSREEALECLYVGLSVLYSLGGYQFQGSGCCLKSFPFQQAACKILQKAALYVATFVKTG